ncbi:helix-turn-helix domain-containing protein [Heyndrickxia acidicola]|uniref:Helix-turn-helix domain-containing protein n=1 Tax=Heyndrickxia acidicola TaxID=209389 RepID=A0ABU6MP48_9BACI|nr:helix-turn-helix domain-containing protein [Heyndrickxia acidicola]MED1206148.1 helix-turn-helix domain-containing protein [Heyndrickxia acidicola]
MSKKAIKVIADTSSYENLSSFDCIEDLNKTVRKYRDLIKASVKRSDLKGRLIILLELLKRHSCKQIGVSYMCKNTIANIMELSYKTVQRLMKKLEELGIIRQIAMKRKKSMLQTSNAIIIQPIQEEVSNKDTVEKGDKCPTLFKTKTTTLKQKINRLRTYETVIQHNDKNSFNDLPVEFCSDRIPKEFVKLMSYYFNKAFQIDEFYKCYMLVCDKYNQQESYCINIALDSFRQLIRKMKRSTINNPFGFYTRILQKKMKGIYIRSQLLNN